MKLETAKRLKAAGYPQDGKSGYYQGVGLGPSLGKNDSYYTPSTDELLEALGERFLSLNKNVYGQWWAYGLFPDDVNSPMYFKGDSPAEALASLWMAVNE